MEKNNFETSILKAPESKERQQYLEDILLYKTFLVFIRRTVTEPCSLLRSNLPGNQKKEWVLLMNENEYSRMTIFGWAVVRKIKAYDKKWFQYFGKNGKGLLHWSLGTLFPQLSSPAAWEITPRWGCSSPLCQRTPLLLFLTGYYWEFFFSLFSFLFFLTFLFIHFALFSSPPSFLTPSISDSLHLFSPFLPLVTFTINNPRVPSAMSPANWYISVQVNLSQHSLCNRTYD